MIGLVRLLGLLPLGLTQRIGRGLGWLLWLRRTRSREVARVNLALTAPDMDTAERDQLLKKTLLHNGMTGAEMGVFWGKNTIDVLSLIRRVHNAKLLDDALADSRGVLILAPHIGNWEQLNTYLSNRCQITIMFKPAKNPQFDSWMRQRRQNTGATLVPTTAGGVRALFKTLQQGSVAGFLPDQEPERRSGVIVPFMGVPTLTPRMPHELLQRTGARALMAFALRRPDAEGFDVHFLEPDADIYSKDADVACTALNRSVEQVVAMAPEQYQWTYKRFKRQPDGAPSPYKAAGVP
ncbi:MULTISPECIES: lysophospholipid acyltransferase family protein [unclassified Oceanobacter]|uniref:lysophospholipid acyltransferase family protein n=2 Tax=Gammaproteobacteria TaxID=1236 RepID=UPI0027341F8D|nr:MULTISPECIES: lysophospholipid acyltransferase family protein [unclassified Oceanobacter]MDP2607743.1 lysophospholipid acyltransferase family protein [Oceanobacter sp. 1_MG-2023]MDP2611073.1 lysophospholipid acyltransferase family protein [Oceanobacter sp. 2_MG-2023]